MQRTSIVVQMAIGRSVCELSNSRYYFVDYILLYNACSLTGIHTLVKRNVKKLRSLLSSECFSSFLSTLSMCARINYILSRNLYLGTISIDIHRSLFILRFISFYNVINKLIKQYLFASVQALHASIINSWIRGYLLKKLIKS